MHILTADDQQQHQSWITAEKEKNIKYKVTKIIIIISILMPLEVNIPRVKN